MGQIIIDRIGDVVVSCSTGTLSSEDIERVVEELQERLTNVYVAGAAGDVAMDPASRNKLYRMLKKRGIRVVAVSDSKVVRGIITAASWMGVSIHSQSWQDIDPTQPDIDGLPDRRPLDLLIRQRIAVDQRAN